MICSTAEFSQDPTTLSVAESASGPGVDTPTERVESNLLGAVAVLPVADHESAVAWYQAWIGREADVVRMEGVAEWKLAGTAWLQVALDDRSAGQTTVVVTVRSVAAQSEVFAAAGLTLGETQDFGFIKMAEAVDPAGNKVVFVQETPGAGAN